jgi:hypothetical protein
MYSWRRQLSDFTMDSRGWHYVVRVLCSKNSQRAALHAEMKGSLTQTGRVNADKSSEGFV